MADCGFAIEVYALHDLGMEFVYFVIGQSINPWFLCAVSEIS